METYQPFQPDPNWPLLSHPDDPFYEEVLRAINEEGDFALFRETAMHDFWFFCRHVLSLGKVPCQDEFSSHYGKPWLDHQWLFDRCREVQAEPDGMIDLWPRFHFKTAIITQSYPLWELIRNRELRFGLITYKLEKVGESFLKQIKDEITANQLLKDYWPEVFYQDPEKESPQHTLKALCTRRSLNPKEPTFGVFSLDAGMTAFHVDRKIFDDSVVEKSVRSSEAIDDTTEKIRNFAGTSSDQVVNRFVGTRWAVGDSYEPIIKSGLAKLRYHDLYDEETGEPVLRSRAWCEEMYRHMTLIGGETHWACVMRNKPELAGNLHFDLSWLTYYDQDPLELRKGLNAYLIIDTAQAGSKTRGYANDFTVCAVIGLGKGTPHGHYFLLDLVRDRMGLVQLTEKVFELIDKWKPSLTFIEAVGTARDHEHILAVQKERKHEFPIVPYDDKTKKVDNIKLLQPLFKQKLFHLPRRLRSTTEGKPVDLIERFIQVEYRVWSPSVPSRYDDILDVLSRVRSKSIAPRLTFPVGRPLSTEAPREESSWERAKRLSQRGPSSHEAEAWSI